jgi:hypothetical protein
MADVYLDQNIARATAELLRTQGHTVTTAHQVGMDRATDDAQLLLAAQRGWVLVTHNIDDFILLHDAWRRWSAAWGVSSEHAGILILDEVVAAEIARAVGTILRSGNPLANQLYRWRRRSGWTRRR